MAIVIARSTASDRADIINLMNEARGDGLNDAERAKQGFVRGRMDEAMLARFQDGLGVFLHGPAAVDR